jgi:membrane-bound lytic murein transglycosylase B
MNRRLFLLGSSFAAAGLCARTAAAADDADFAVWLKALRDEAARKGISARTIEDALTGLTPIQRVIELDRRQPEVMLTFDTYISRVINDARIEAGRQRLRENIELLTRVSRRYGVQPRFIVALWAIETDFGRVTGGFPVIQALATLAYEGRRAAFFREELFNALRVAEKSGIPAREMRGSWAGAMGQSQFMPSSYLAYAVDFDGDGRADIWNSRPDVFASIANYLSKVGWRADETWGRAVRPTAALDPSMVDDRRLQNPPRPLASWQALGLRRTDGGALPARDLPAWLIQPGGAEGPSFLVYANYRTLLHWNRSLFFATAVGYLADRISEG